MDEEYVRKLHEELNKDIDWDVSIDHVKQKAKEGPFVQRYQLEEEENRAIESINETLSQKAAKRRKLNEEVEDLKRHLEIVPDEDDDVYTEATPLARKRRKKDKPKLTLDNSTFDGVDADLDVDHGMDYMDTEEPMNEGRLSEETKEHKLTTDTKEITQDKGSGEKRGSTKELVSTARPEDSTVRPDVGTTDPITPPTTTSRFDNDDITMAQTLIKMKEEKAKKRVSIKDIEDSSRHARSILTLKPLPTIDPKEKGKGVLKEPEPAKKMTRSDLDVAQIAKDTEVARLAYEEELAELEREKEKRQREEETSKAAIPKMYDEVQAGIEADALFAASSNRNKKKSIQLKREQSSRLKQLLLKEDSELHKDLLRLEKIVIDDFKPMDSDDAVDKEKVLEKPASTKVKVKQEGDDESIKKRPSRRLKMKVTKNSKRQKKDSDIKEEEHLKTFMQIVPDEEGEVDYEVLDKRFPIINWESKFYHLDRHGAECIYYRIFRYDGSSRWIKTFSKLVTRFDRMDLEELYNLVMQRFETTSTEGVGLVLWGDLRTMFEENVDDDL
nr:hypothetical protein [Tanacetum cinerariifolium]